MKVVSYLVLMICANSVFASGHAINITTEPHQYSMYTDLMKGIAEEHQDNLSDKLGNDLECRLVKVKMNVIKEPGVFKKGLYTLTLSAICNKAFSNLALKVTYGEDYGNPWGMTVSYTSAGRKYSIYSEQTSRD